MVFVLQRWASVCWRWCFGFAPGASGCPFLVHCGQYWFLLPQIKLATAMQSHGHNSTVPCCCVLSLRWFCETKIFTSYNFFLSSAQSSKLEAGLLSCGARVFFFFFFNRNRINVSIINKDGLHHGCALYNILKLLDLLTPRLIVIYWLKMFRSCWHLHLDRKKKSCIKTVCQHLFHKGSYLAVSSLQSEGLSKIITSSSYFVEVK